MKNNNKNLKKVIVYIDGYNLYYGLRSAYKGKYKWLDLQALSESFLQKNMSLIAVKYFTAITKSNSETKNRQEIFLKALAVHCDKLEITYGRFLSKTKQCRECGNTHQSYEEKKTDVNIACQILNDAHLDKYDYCYVVSGDSDLVPPVEIVKQLFPDKTIIVAHPPKRKSAELCKVADGYFAISKQKIKVNQLPQSIQNTTGNELTKPKTWI
ncbi:MAG: NYN domain-containing protein [Candidatus Thioglobus sp.]|uniref:NYN domain-containing protein n=1 Tax=Candidatus Thioglobus sp. TaxID=2026721 RepID=UPI0026208358|nr:NYN domain-containing protein [Candidatus Thioglobus sp.]MDC9727550.1 NYN domain-containing protein [Candidatus Thioglobus sp.]